MQTCAATLAAIAKPKFFQRFALLSVCGAVCVSAVPLNEAFGAENLRLRQGLSYDSDTDKGFPIIADKIDDVAVEPGKASYIFFGAAGDLNTSRQAKRVVDLYKRYKTNNIKFIVIDVDHPSPEAKRLIKSYYQGYIPAQVLLDKTGRTNWSHTGEVAPGELSTRVEKVI